MALSTALLVRVPPLDRASASTTRSSTTGRRCFRPPRVNWHQVPAASQANSGTRSGATTATEGRVPSRSSYEIEGPRDPSSGRRGSRGGGSRGVRRAARGRGGAAPRKGRNRRAGGRETGAAVGGSRGGGALGGSGGRRGVAGCRRAREP